MLLFLFGFALVLPLMAQEIIETPETLILQIEGEGSSTNRVTMETGIKEEDSSALEISLVKEMPDEARKEQEAAPALSENSTMNTKQSFLMDTGVQYSEEGEYKEAARAYLRALAVDPENESIQFRLSTLYLLMGRDAEAILVLEALVAKFPENANVRNNLAWAYTTGKGVRNKEKALRNAREAILSAPVSPPMWNTLAETYYVIGDYDRALRASEHAIDLLIQTASNPEKVASFEAQHNKIRRAAEALEIFNGVAE